MKQKQNAWDECMCVHAHVCVSPEYKWVVVSNYSLAWLSHSCEAQLHLKYC